MRRRAIVSVVGATALLAASVAGASSAAALVSGASAPASQSFGSIPVYGSVVKTITVTVTDAPVTFGSPSIEPVGGATDQADDYAVGTQTCAGATINAGSTCAVAVTFNPFAAGLRQAALEIPTTSPAGLLTVALSGTAVPNATGTYYPLTTPQRAIDTRTAGTKLPLAPGSTTAVQITNRFGIPATGVSAVVLNVTAVNTTTQGYFKVYPSDKPRPDASSINFPKAWTGANMVTVPVGADGKVKIYNYGGKAHAIVDVLGWYAKDDSVRAAKNMGSQFLAAGTGDPVRIYDSRSELPFLNGEYIDFQDIWDTEAQARSVKAYAVSITAVNPTSSGVLTAWSGTGAKPTASTVNYLKGVIAPNMAVVTSRYYTTVNDVTHETEQSSGFRIQNTGSGQVDLVVDLTGYYVTDDLAGMRFVPLTGSPSPRRILDTRTGVGLSGPFGSKQTRTAPATSVATSDSIYVVGNLTGDQPTLRTYLTVWAEGTKPLASNLNVNAGATRAVSAYAPLAYNEVSGALTYKIYNDAGSMRVIFDAAGTLDIYPSQAGLPAPPAAAKATAGADARTADRVLGGRTIPGAATFVEGLDASTHRRG